MEYLAAAFRSFDQKKVFPSYSTLVLAFLMCEYFYSRVPLVSNVAFSSAILIY
jgi:hypothetical protein